MVPYSIEDLRQIISPIALQYGVESVSLFGSYSKGSAGADSDVDLKIEKDSFAPCLSYPGLGRLSRMP